MNPINLPKFSIGDGRAFAIGLFLLLYVHAFNAGMIEAGNLQTLVNIIFGYLFAQIQKEKS